MTESKFRPVLFLFSKEFKISSPLLHHNEIQNVNGLTKCIKVDPEGTK